MEYQELADSYQTAACVLSVEKNADGGCGEIRVAAGNSQYADMIGHPGSVPGGLCQTYMPEDPAFEELCFRAAVQKETLHTYMSPDGQDGWFHVFALPLEDAADGRYHCMYVTKRTDMTPVQSAKISEDVLKTCLRLDGTDDFRTTMDEVVHDIRVMCGAEICTILLMDYAAQTCSVLSADLQKDSKLKRVMEFDNFFFVADTWLGMMGEDDCIIIRSEEEMQHVREVNHAWWTTLDEAGVNSLVLFPLQFNGEILGFIWATNFDTQNTARIRETLDLTTFFVSSHIASYKMMKRLEHIGYTDMLTGVQNRNAMNNRVSSILEGEACPDTAIGIVFADLNGLKTVNDTQGHAAGDLLLKKAALLLQELFAEDEIYRAGGDEFVVIVTGCTAGRFAERVQALKERADMPEHVCFAVGSWYVQSGCDIRDAMRLADESMYKDKEDFYRRHPERDRRRRA